MDTIDEILAELFGKDELGQREHKGGLPDEDEDLSESPDIKDSTPPAKPSDIKDPTPLELPMQSADVKNPAPPAKPSDIKNPTPPVMKLSDVKKPTPSAKPPSDIKDPTLPAKPPSDIKDPAPSAKPPSDVKDPDVDSVPVAATVSQSSLVIQSDGDNHTLTDAEIHMRKYVAEVDAQVLSTVDDEKSPADSVSIPREEDSSDTSSEDTSDEDSIHYGSMVYKEPDHAVYHAGFVDDWEEIPDNPPRQPRRRHGGSQSTIFDDDGVLVVGGKKKKRPKDEPRKSKAATADAVQNIIAVFTTELSF